MASNETRQNSEFVDLKFFLGWADREQEKCLRAVCDPLGPSKLEEALQSYLRRHCDCHVITVMISWLGDRKKRGGVGGDARKKEVGGMQREAQDSRERKQTQVSYLDFIF